MNQADDPVNDLVVKSVADSTDVTNPPELNQLIYTQVLELIGEDNGYVGVDDLPYTREGIYESQARLKRHLIAELKAKYIGALE
jgi:hypothetical protein